MTTSTLIRKLSRAWAALARPLWQQLPLLGVLIVTWGWPVLPLVKHLSPLMPTQNLRTYTSLSICLLICYLLTALVCYCRKFWVKLAVYAVSLLNGLISLFVWYNFGSAITNDMAVAIAETTASETSEFFSTFLLSHASLHAYARILLLSGLSLAAEWFWATFVRSRRMPLLPESLIAIIAAAILVCGTESFIRVDAPMLAYDDMAQMENDEFWMGDNYGVDCFNRYLSQLKMLSLVSGQIHQVAHASLQVYSETQAQATPAQDSLTLVVVIGESYIKHHASLYGYPHLTTPIMQREQQQGRLIAFTDVVAPYNTTSPVLKCLFSTASGPDGEHWWQHPMWPAIFKAGGWRVSYWDNQLNYGRKTMFTLSLNSLLFNPRVMQACYDAVADTTFDYDGQLVADFAAQQPKLHAQSPRQLVIFHLMGQHVAFDKRYPHNAAFSRFTPDSVRRQAPYLTPQAKQLIAHYDNATLYNDSVMGQVFSMLRGKNAVVVYFSDHGEEVCDYRDHVGRDQEKDKTPQLLRYQNQVPFVIWCSPRYQATHPQLVQRIRQAAGRPFLNTQVSSMIFTLAGITTPHYHPQRDPLSPQFTPKPRIVYDHYNYDAIMRRH